MVSVARQYLSQTSYLTSSELSEAMRAANPDLKGHVFEAEWADGDYSGNFAGADRGEVGSGGEGF